MDNARYEKCMVCGEKNAGPIGKWRVLTCTNCGQRISIMALEYQNILKPSNLYDDPSYIASRISESEAQMQGNRKRLADLKAVIEFKQLQTILEVGCSTGEMLAILKKEGHKPYGYETAEGAAKFGRDHFKVEITSDAGVLTKQFYDSVFAFHVIEHVDNSVRFIKYITKNMKTGGTLYIRTPHYRSLSAYLFGQNWPGYCVDHTIFITKNSMEKTLHATGFRVEKIWTESEGRYFLGGLRRVLSGGSQPVGGNGVGTTGYLSRKMLFIVSVFNLLYTPISLIEKMLGKGDEINVVATKVR